MKKALFSLALSILFIQCTPNQDPEEEEKQENPENLEISITIDGELLNESREKILYISNDEGIIEGQISLLNNQENLLSIEREPDTEYYAIIHDKLFYDYGTSNEFRIFENMESSEYTIKANSNNSGTSGDLPKIDLYMVNTGSLELIGMSGGGSATASSANGGTYEYNGSFTSKPGDYYISLKKEGETFARYFWTENAEEDKSFSLDYEDLPIAPVVETQIPEYESGTIFVHGFKSEKPHILGYGGTQGLQPYETYVPEEAVFDYISFNARFFNGTTSYSFNSVSEAIPSSIPAPSFDFTINNFSVDDTDYTTTGNYDFSSANFIFSDDNFSLVVKVFSEQNSRVSFSIGTLISSLLEEVPGLNAAQLEPDNISLSSYNYRSNYEEAVKGLIEDNGSGLTPGNIEEIISKND